LKQLKRPDKYSDLKVRIKAIYDENKGRFGYRRITLELQKKMTVNHKTVLKLMREMEILSRVRMKRYTSYRGEVGKIAPNLLNREFKADTPNLKWVTDITEFSLFGKKLYLSPILDLFNGEIISYSLTERPTFKDVMSMLEEAYQRIDQPSGLMLHSDQGWQYQMKAYQISLKQHGIIQSMSRKANCLDNAVMENFFGHVKSELLYLQDFKSLEHFRSELIDYIHYYNHKRIKVKLKGLSPVDYRLQSFNTA